MKFVPYLLMAMTPLSAYACGDSPRNSAVTPPTRLVETYQSHTIKKGDRVWTLAQRATGETDPSKTASVVNGTVKYTVREKNGPRRLLEDVNGDGIRGDNVRPGDVVYFLVQRLSPEEIRKNASTRTAFLHEMRKRGYWFSCEYWNELSLNEMFAKPPDEIWLGPSPKDRIHTATLNTTPSGLMLVLGGGVDKVAENTAKKFGIVVRYESWC